LLYPAILFILYNKIRKNTREKRGALLGAPV